MEFHRYVVSAWFAYATPTLGAVLVAVAHTSIVDPTQPPVLG